MKSHEIMSKSSFNHHEVPINPWNLPCFVFAETALEDFLRKLTALRTLRLIRLARAVPLEIIFQHDLVVEPPSHHLVGGWEQDLFIFPYIENWE